MTRPHPAKIIYTEGALQQLQSIRAYLLRKFSPREIQQLKSVLLKFEQTVLMMPLAFPEYTLKKGVRKAVLSKNLSVYYRIRRETLQIVSILDNRRNASDWV